MNGDTSGKISKAEPGTDWQRLRGMTDEEVHAAVVADPEIRPTDDAFWDAARVVTPQPGERFKRAVKRISYEAFWLNTYQTAINRLYGVEAIGIDFFRVSLTALEDARLIRLIRILEKNRRVASIWYLHRCNPSILNLAFRQAGLDLAEVEAISENIRNIRDKAFVHIDKENVFEPQKLYRNAGLKRDKVALLCSGLWEIMKGVYRLTYHEEFKHDVYNGDDIRLLTTLRDENEKQFL